MFTYDLLFDLYLIRYRNGHLKSELREKHAGKLVPDIQKLPPLTKVATLEKGTQYWWEHGEIIVKQTGEKAITVYDAIYDGTEHEVYLDTRCKNYKRLCKELKL